MSNTTKFKIPISPRNEEHLLWKPPLGPSASAERLTPSSVDADAVKDSDRWREHRRVLDKLIEKVAKMEAKLWMWEHSVHPKGEEHP